MVAPRRVGLTGSRSLAAQHSIPIFPFIVLNQSVLECYLSPVFAKLHTRRTPARTPGKAPALLFRSHESPTCPDLVGVTSHLRLPFFSYTYELQIFYLLSFDIHTSMGVGVGSPWRF